MVHKNKAHVNKERYIEYPEIEVMTGEEEIPHDDSQGGEKVKQEPETLRLTRFHFVLILACALCIFSYRVLKCAFAGFFALLTAFKNKDDNDNFAYALNEVKLMFVHCCRMALGVIVPRWGAYFIR